MTTVPAATCASPLAASALTRSQSAQLGAPHQGSPSLKDSASHPSSPTSPHTSLLQSLSVTPPASVQLLFAPQHLPPFPPQPAGLVPHLHTSVNLHLLDSLLTGHPNRDFTTYLIRGLTFGFRVSYQGNHSPRPASNLRSSLARPQVIDSYLEAECQAGHTIGPFPSPPLTNFVVNPLGAVPKKRSGKWRLIMHLSYPPGSSVNDGIDVEDFPLRYSTVYDAVDSVMQLGRGALMAKIDIKSAFRLCPVHPADHHLLGMQWKGQFYFDRVLPFGLRSAPFIFNCLADAIEWVAVQRGVTPIHHYLDDFFIAGIPDSTQCTHHLHTLTSLCSSLGVPLAEDKREGPTTCLEYLGILLDSDALEARLLPDKLQDILLALTSWSSRPTCQPLPPSSPAGVVGSIATPPSWGPPPLGALPSLRRVSA